MKRPVLHTIAVFIFLMLLLPFTSLARDIEPIVSTDWLQQHASDPKLVIVDIRKVEEFKTGHIPNAVNVVYGSFAIMKAGLRNEMPHADDLSDVLSSAGIGADSHVVVVGNADTVPNRTDISRVAITLRYAGVTNVAILDGGYGKWLAEKKPVATDIVKPKPVKHDIKANEAMFVKKDYVLGAIGKVTMIDTREPEFYEGKKKMDFVAKPGRIKGAVNLPPSQAYTKDGTFKTRAELAALVAKAAGSDPAKEIILYCDTGKVCSSWGYVMTELLGYKNVRIYDGSTEEWMKDPKAPAEP
ncbi:MAG TPA: sulfurtransferase [Syntrophorhabdaceae bacterium]|nr:sulfurtransferase [Syntrophorhabdaceae bacterium]